MYGAGHPKLVLCDDLEGWGGQRGWGGSPGRGHMYAYGQFMLMYGKNYHNIEKQLSSSENKSIVFKKKHTKGQTQGESMPKEGRNVVLRPPLRKQCEKQEP